MLTEKLVKETAEGLISQLTETLDENYRSSAELAKAIRQLQDISRKMQRDSDPEVQLLGRSIDRGPLEDLLSIADSLNELI